MTSAPSGGELLILVADRAIEVAMCPHSISSLNIRFSTI